MLRRYAWPARLLGGSVFLVSVCVVLPIILFREVAAVVSGAAGGPAI